MKPDFKKTIKTKISIKKILVVSIFVLALIIVIGAASGVIYIYAMEHTAKFLYAHRAHDSDKDGIPDFQDEDIDNDGIPNMRDNDADGDGTPNTQKALKAARNLIGRPYDFFNELTESPMTKYGAIVCIDVVIYAYEKAGIYLEKEMRDYYFKNPKIFYDRNWNNPNDKNFARRVRNFRPYCKANNFILEKGAELKPGDIIVIGNGHIAMIEKVKGDDFITIEASSKKIITKRTKKTDIVKRGTDKYGNDIVFVRLKFD